MMLMLMSLPLMDGRLQDFAPPAFWLLAFCQE
jgi:hypothetical protein